VGGMRAAHGGGLSVDTLGDLLLVSALAVVAMMLAVWVLSLVVRDASIVDSFWSLGFVLVAGVALIAGPGVFERRLIVFALVAVWGVRLSLHIARRNWGRGEDYRYQGFRARWGDRFWWVSLFTVFLLQAAIMFVVSLPVQVAGAGATPAALGVWDWLGAAVWLFGFAFETIGDAQLAAFKADPANRGTVMDRGLWRYTRHPNYFGDATLWWGLGLIGAATPWGLAALAGPAVMTFMLVRVSGVAMLEKTIAERRPGYAEYVRRTSAFLPLPPKHEER
jgi:steroid 5-alpha reductase family enzyme